MATFKLLESDEVKELQFPENTEFYSYDHLYRVQLSPPEEIRMAYFIRNVTILKNKRIWRSGQSCDPSYLEILSPDKRFLFIPFYNSYEIFDLLKNTSFTDNIYFLTGNHFDKTGKYLLTIGQQELKMIDLERMKTAFTYQDKRLFISQAHFSEDNCIQIIKKSDTKQILISLNPENIVKTEEIIPSPFDFMNIDKSKYQKLFNLNQHCLLLPQSRGMLHSCMLDSWQYLKTTEKIVYKSTIPVSDVYYNSNYNTYTCDIENIYVSLEK